MDSVSKPVEMKYMRGMTVGTDTGWISPTTGPSNPGPGKLRGIERNTARGVKMPVQIMDVIKLEHAPATDAPPVTPFDTYGDDE